MRQNLAKPPLGNTVQIGFIGLGNVGAKLPGNLALGEQWLTVNNLLKEAGESLLAGGT